MLGGSKEILSGKAQKESLVLSGVDGDDAGMDPLPSSAKLIVIGGGFVGAGIALHLAEAGIEDVLLLERSDLAGGSSGKPIGGVRAQFSDR
jgi:NADPH-dependent 2,4-dienoyl-CoA reductase/sulfur reductase-like enzyme